VRVSLHPSAYLEPVHLRHHHVAEQDVNGALFQTRESVSPVGPEHEVVPFSSQERRKGVACSPVIVDEEDLGHSTTY
jgi:hypothetical protein